MMLLMENDFSSITYNLFSMEGQIVGHTHIANKQNTIGSGIKLSKLF